MTKAPHIDWGALSPVIALIAGACIVLMAGLMRGRTARTAVVPLLTVATLAAAIGLGIWQWSSDRSLADVTLIENALRMDDLTLAIMFLCCTAGIATVLLSLRGHAAEEAGHGEYHALLLSSVLGMVVLAGSTNLVALFVGFELLSIPLYVLCATEMRRATSLESGLKYLIVGSVGSATLLYGLALVYGATGATDFGAIARSLEATGFDSDVLLLTGVALCITGLAFKVSVAPFHQWTPDVYEGAPTPITAFMAVATKAAAFGVFLRLFDEALIPAADDWAPLLALLACVTIVVGNVGALGQSSLKRLLAYSSVAQAGYMLAGVLVTTRLGVQAVVFYLAAYLLMNLAVFAVIVIRERETGRGDDISTLHGLGADRPWLAWAITIGMLGLAGIPGTVGFFGKIYLVEAAVDNEYAFVAVAIVLGSAISLAYYLRVIAAVWMREPGASLLPRRTPGGAPVMAGGSPEADQPGAGDDEPGPGGDASGDLTAGGGGDESGRDRSAFGKEHSGASEADEPGSRDPAGGTRAAAAAEDSPAAEEGAEAAARRDDATSAEAAAPAEDVADRDDAGGDPGEDATTSAQDMESGGKRDVELDLAPGAGTGDRQADELDEPTTPPDPDEGDRSDATSSTRGGGAGPRMPTGGGDEATGRSPVTGAAGKDARDPEPESAAQRQAALPAAVLVAVACAAATLFFGIYPSPLFDFAREAGTAIQGLL